MAEHEYEIVITMEETRGGGRDGYDFSIPEHFVMYFKTSEPDSDSSFMVSGNVVPDDFEKFGITLQEVNAYLLDKYNYLPEAGRTVRSITKKRISKNPVLIK